MVKDSDTESNSTSASSCTVERRRSERLRKKYGEDLERFHYSVSPSPIRRRRKLKAEKPTSVDVKFDEEKEAKTTNLPSSQVLETVPEGKNSQTGESTFINSNLVDSPYDVDTRTGNKCSNSFDPSNEGPSGSDIVKEYDEFCRMLQPHLYTKYSVAAFQVAKDLYLVRKWSFIRVFPLVSMECYVVVGCPSPVYDSTIYSVIPVPTDSMLTPELMDRLVMEALKEKLGHKVSGCIFAIIENDTTTAYYRITNTFEDLIREKETDNTFNESTNKADSERCKELDEIECL